MELEELGKISITLVLILSLVFGIWFYTGFPRIWQSPSIPPGIEMTQAATSTPPDLAATSTPVVTPVATSTPATTSTPEITASATSTTNATSTTSATSTPADNSTSTQAVPSPSSTEEPASQTEEPPEEEFIEESVPQPEPQPESTPPTPPLKERKLTKEIHIDAGARHSCAAKNFSLNLFGVNQAIMELEFTGMRSDLENLEIGSLPLGIDITFLNNADYSWSPSKSDSGAVLQIINQPGSQKGNFSIPIIYTSGNSTTVCQINVINF